MKIAGSKNDGAWFRTNAVITKLNGGVRAVLAGKIAATDFADLAYNDMVAYAAETGIADALEVPATMELWITAMIAHGVPRQVWYGRLTTTTYTKTGEGAEATYTANYTYNLHRFAKDLRKILRKFVISGRQTIDVFNMEATGIHNPGGFPDAIKGGQGDAA